MYFMNHQVLHFYTRYIFVVSQSSLWVQYYNKHSFIQSSILSLNHCITQLKSFIIWYQVLLILSKTTTDLVSSSSRSRHCRLCAVAVGCHWVKIWWIPEWNLAG